MKLRLVFRAHWPIIVPLVVQVWCLTTTHVEPWWLVLWVALDIFMLVMGALTYRNLVATDKAWEEFRSELSRNPEVERNVIRLIELQSEAVRKAVEEKEKRDGL